jgi:2-haloacid dehalogenase
MPPAFSTRSATPSNVDGPVGPALLSFDVFGTLIDTPAGTAAPFRSILADAGAGHLDPDLFWDHWEERNIAHYREPYQSYKEICRISLEETFRHFRIPRDHDRLIQRYFEAFPRFELYPDVAPTLEALAPRHRLAVVSNIDDDLLAATRLGRDFDLVCTAEKARGYKPDGSLFRYLIDRAGVGVEKILHSGQSQFTDMVGGKPLGLTVAWINRRGLSLHPSVPRPDFIFPGLAPLGSFLLT